MPDEWGAQPENLPAWPQPRTTNGMAIASLACSLVGLSMLGVIFGHVASNQIKRNRNQDGWGMATAGLLIGYIGLVVYLALIVSATADTTLIPGMSP